MAGSGEAVADWQYRMGGVRCGSAVLVRMFRVRRGTAWHGGRLRKVRSGFIRAGRLRYGSEGCGSAGSGGWGAVGSLRCGLMGFDEAVAVLMAWRGSFRRGGCGGARWGDIGSYMAVGVRCFLVWRGAVWRLGSGVVRSIPVRLGVAVFIRHEQVRQGGVR